MRWFAQDGPQLWLALLLAIPSKGIPVKPLARLWIVVLLGTVAAMPDVASTATPRTCADPAAPLTVEEQRLAQPKTGEVLQRSGFDSFATTFTPALCALRNDRKAERAMQAQGRALWEAAVARAQGRLPAGSLPANDDRPLYWARLQLTRALRQWTPPSSSPWTGARS